jgi:rhodanese-related sulfurtransferase
VVESVATPAVVVVTVDVLTAARELQLKEKQSEEEEEEEEEEEDEQVVWQYLDVRTEQEMVEGHLHNSLNVPYMFLTPQGKQCIKRTSFLFVCFLTKQSSTPSDRK